MVCGTPDGPFAGVDCKCQIQLCETCLLNVCDMVLHKPNRLPTKIGCRLHKKFIGITDQKFDEKALTDPCEECLLKTLLKHIGGLDRATFQYVRHGRIWLGDESQGLFVPRKRKRNAVEGEK